MPETETLPKPKTQPPRPPKPPKRTSAPAEQPKGKPRRRKEWWQKAEPRRAAKGGSDIETNRPGFSYCGRFDVPKSAR